MIFRYISELLSKALNLHPSAYLCFSSKNTWYLEKNPDKLALVLQKLFVFAFTWAFGGILKREDEHKDDTVFCSAFEPDCLADVTYSFDNFVHKLFENISQIGMFMGASL